MPIPESGPHAHGHPSGLPVPANRSRGERKLAAAQSLPSRKRGTAARTRRGSASSPGPCPGPRDVDVGESHVEGSTQGDALNERLRPGHAPTQGRALRRGSHRARIRRACEARGTPPDARRGSDGPRCLDEVAAVDLGRDLQPLAFEAHAVVPIDRALVVFAHDVGQSRTDEGHEGRPRLGRRHRALLVECRPVVFDQRTVRTLHRVDALGGKLLGQPFPRFRGGRPCAHTPPTAAPPPPGSVASPASLHRPSSNRIFRTSCSSSVRLMGHLLKGLRETGQSTYYTGQITCS